MDTTYKITSRPIFECIDQSQVRPGNNEQIAYIKKYATVINVECTPKISPLLNSFINYAMAYIITAKAKGISIEKIRPRCLFYEISMYEQFYDHFNLKEDLEILRKFIEKSKFLNNVGMSISNWSEEYIQPNNNIVIRSLMKYIAKFSINSFSEFKTIMHSRFGTDFNILDAKDINNKAPYICNDEKKDIVINLIKSTQNEELYFPVIPLAESTNIFPKLHMMQPKQHVTGAANTYYNVMVNRVSNIASFCFECKKMAEENCFTNHKHDLEVCDVFLPRLCKYISELQIRQCYEMLIDKFHSEPLIKNMIDTFFHKLFPNLTIIHIQYSSISNKLESISLSQGIDIINEYKIGDTESCKKCDKCYTFIDQFVKDINEYIGDLLCFKRETAIM